MCAALLLTCAPKKPARMIRRPTLSTTLMQVHEDDENEILSNDDDLDNIELFSRNNHSRTSEAIELDSLEAYSIDENPDVDVETSNLPTHNQQLSSNHSNSNNAETFLSSEHVRIEEKHLKRLNLNGICKNNNGTFTTGAFPYATMTTSIDTGVNSHTNSNSAICYVEDIILPEQSIQTLQDLQAISARSNELHSIPASILKLSSLLVLDLADNNLLTVPPEISRLINLRELILDQNALSVLPSTIWDLRRLKVLKIGHNRLALPPDKHAEMRSLVLPPTDNNEIKPENSCKTNILTNLNLRANRLKGNIILGNYGSLTELDVSENSIEILDLTAVEHLQTLQCSRNSLAELTLYGKNLTSIIAGNNRIRQIAVNYPPEQLKHFDISYNELESLPEWMCNCTELRSLFASNNHMRHLPDHLFCNEMPFLHTVQLAYNQLESLPNIQRRLPIQEMFLQNNSLSILPENFFKYIPSIKVLNLSNNRLCDLPQPDDELHLEKLYLTANCLTDKSLEKLVRYLRSLKSLHAAYNNFTSMPESCPQYWTEIEELVFSGNKLLRLPEHIGRLKHLSVLRVHSNLLQNIPQLSQLFALRILDLAHNQLDRIDLTSLVPPHLKFLDLSCNMKLHVDSQQFHTYRTQRPMSLVDVSGKNRTSLPISPSPFCENEQTETCWTVGFSETSGSKQKLYVSQIRLPNFCNTEGLFGLFDGENNSDMPVCVDKVVPRILLEERTVKETSSDYMKYTMLSAHRELKDKGQKHGMNALIVHILKSKVNAEYSFCGGVKKYAMRIASVGDARLVLGRSSGPIRLLPTKQRKTIRTNPQLQLMVPDPDVTEIFLDEQDEYMIIANKNLWDVMSPDVAIKEVSLQRNVILAAKRLQDLAQSYGAEENLSVIVVKFNLIGSDVDLLMKELRQTIRKNKYQDGCQPGCCCEALNNECVNCEKLSMPMNHDDRSSPSGQSEHACSDCHSGHAPAKMFVNQLNRQQLETRSMRSITPHFESAEVKISPERRSYRGVARAVRARTRIDEDQKSRNEESDSALSEEQFKCWEYMLEQNTQLLFDKELNTLNRSKKSPFTLKNSTLSRSSPHLSQENSTSSNSTGTGSFLSRQFGSARSFNPITNRANMNSVINGSRMSVDKKLIGGPHAAYFGSLQRLMPYNLEYDFAVMQERGLADSLDLDRMQQYWGVTTTEL